MMDESEASKEREPQIEEVPVMVFYEEPEHLRLLVRTNQGVVTRYLSREDATQMMRWIGSKNTTVKSDILVTV